MRKKRREADPPLTTAIIDRIEDLRVRKGWSREQLALKSGISLRRIQDWLGAPGRQRAASGSPFRPRLENISCVAEALEAPLHELLHDDSREGGPGVVQRRDDFANLSRIAHQVDGELIEITRRLGQSPVRVIRSAYRSVLNDRLQQHGFTLKEWTQMLEDPAAQDSLVDSLPVPGLAH